MTINEQIEIKFGQLAQLSKERASEVIERIADKPSEQQLFIIKVELSALADKKLKNSSIVKDDIIKRFMAQAESHWKK